MTDASDAGRSGASASAERALTASSRYAEALKIAASMCIAMFSWMRQQKAEYVPLLDYDIICGASKRLRFHRFGSRDYVSLAHPALIDYSGPATTRYLLDMLPEFVLPPGTVAETINRCQELSLSMSSRADRFLDRLRNAARDPGSLEQLLRGGHEVDILLEDLSSITGDLEDRTLLDSMLRRARPVEHYIAKADEDNSGAKETLKLAYKHLEEQRPNRSLNNLCDALNATALMQMRKYAEARRVVPLLVSETRAVHTLQGLFEWPRNPSTFGALPQFVGKTFLLVSQGLLERTERRFGAAIDEAMLLDQDASLLVESCNKLLSYCHSNRHIPPQAMTVEMLPKVDWHMLLHRRGMFERRWASLFGPPQAAAHLDRADLLRLLSAHDWGARLRVGDRDAFNRRLLQFQSQLKTTRPADYEIWNLIMHRAAQPQSSAGVSVRAAFDLVRRPNDGRLLTEIGLGLPAVDLQEESVEQSHNLQVAALPSYISRGAALIVCSFRDLKISPRRYLRFTWLHGLDTRQAASYCIELVRSCATASQPSGYHANVFKSEGAISLEGAESELTEAIAVEPGVESIQILKDRVRAFADLTRLDDVEMQIGITIPDEVWSPQVADSIARIVSETSDTDINFSYARNLLEECIATLFVHKPDPTGVPSVERKSDHEKTPDTRLH